MNLPAYSEYVGGKTASDKPNKTYPIYIDHNAKFFNVLIKESHKQWF